MTRLVHAGSHVPAGTYRCDSCGCDVRLSEELRLAPCSSCGGTTYERRPEREDRTERRGPG